MTRISLEVVFDGQRLTEDDLRSAAALPALSLPDDELARLLACLRCPVQGCAPVGDGVKFAVCCGEFARIVKAVLTVPRS